VFSIRFALVFALLLLALTAATALAADPSPGVSPLLIDPLDPRAGAGANRVGAPLLAILVVLGVGIVAAAATTIYVRLSRRS
jgi:hypothetical protein